MERRTTDVPGFGRQKQEREKVGEEKQKEREVGRGGDCGFQFGMVAYTYNSRTQEAEARRL